MENLKKISELSEKEVEELIESYKSLNEFLNNMVRNRPKISTDHYPSLDDLLIEELILAKKSIERQRNII